MAQRARLFGVLGDPVDHSLSPAMHNAAFARVRLPHVYLRYRVSRDQLGAALDDARLLGLGGLNLTVPLKEAALPLVDGLTTEARRIGSVNTILVRRGGRLVGDNTDGQGFLRSLRGLVRVRGARVVLVGAGGSARAVASSLARAGCARLTIANRTTSRAEALASALGPAAVDVVPLAMLESEAVLGDADLVVNTTSAGLSGDDVRLRHDATPARALFVDLLYGHRERPTPFVAAAARARRRAMDGSAMLLHQGALAFERWTTRPAPLGTMAAALADAGLSLTRSGGPSTVRAARPGTR